jgi:hypothetical protein
MRQSFAVGEGSQMAKVEQTQLWKVIISYGLEEEFERDWLGRVRSRRTHRYLRAEVTPELAQLLANANAHVAGAASAIAAAPEAVRRLLTKQETDTQPSQ